jgi:nitrate reductase gamma subunit
MPRLDWDHLLFVVLPYAAVVAFFLLIAVRRILGSASAAAPPQRYGERLLFRLGIAVILAGHILAFLLPEQVLRWNGDDLRRYVLEITALVFSLMTLVGPLLAVARGLFSAEARRGVGIADWLLYGLLLLQLASGIFLALFYPWGSSWYASLVVPYLRSLVRLEPDLSLISALPHLFKLHLVTACALVAVLPLTGAMGRLIVPAWEAGQERTAGNVVTAVLLVALALSLITLAPRLWAAHLPGNQQGYEPVQPIAFSHRLHAGELQVSCLYCHGDAARGRHAGIAAASVCMNCHRFVTAPARDVRTEVDLAREEKRPPRTIISPELAKLYAALALDEKMQPDPRRSPEPIRWVRVHNLPAFTRFNHEAHVSAGVECRQCHGPVETMERARQVEDLSMGWCVQCHREANRNGVAGREVHPSNDCTTCHH